MRERILRRRVFVGAMGINPVFRQRGGSLMGEASFDDLIPLADVPATGDISIIWYGATLLSLAGLLVLSLLGRKKTQED